MCHFSLLGFEKLQINTRGGLGNLHKNQTCDLHGSIFTGLQLQLVKIKAMKDHWYFDLFKNSGVNQNNYAGCAVQGLY